jgi:deoxyadenosine/deoxycytidine kinase
MVKKSVAVIGTIGCGKSTLINQLVKKVQALGVQPNYVFNITEPSVTKIDLKEVLERFYKAPEKWAYALQLGVTSAQEIFFNELRELPEYDDSIIFFDAPYSSFMYCNIHVKAGRMTKEQKDAIVSVSRPFPFDYLILVEETADETIKRILKRNRGIELGDLSYMHEHISDYRLFQEDYIKKFFSNAEVIRLTNLPDVHSNEYQKIVQDIAEKLL